MAERVKNPPPQRLCPDEGHCHHGCSPDACWRVQTCSPLTGAYPDGEWPDRIVAAYGGEGAADPACVESTHAGRACPAQAQGALPDRNVLWRVLRTTGNPLAVVTACAFVLHEDNAHLAPEDLADLAAILEFMVDRIERDGL